MLASFQQTTEVEISIWNHTRSLFCSYFTTYPSISFFKIEVKGTLSPAETLLSFWGHLSRLAIPAYL